MADKLGEVSQSTVQDSESIHPGAVEEAKLVNKHIIKDESADKEVLKGTLKRLIKSIEETA
ncbi:MAG TPA: hypothetical protein VL401_03775 [Alphaproteobacteria bacterium]|jgi:hypothetical protein|nr:hypothetical protein [Alphaproteobacteria bacterium]